MAGARQDRTLIVRAVVLACALLASAWFALGAVQVHAQNAATSLIPARTALSPNAARRIDHLLDRAAILNPDGMIRILRAEAEIDAGRRAAAEQEMKRLVHDEPQNVSAWLVLELSADRRDPAAVALAIAKQQALVPPVRAAP